MLRTSNKSVLLLYKERGETPLACIKCFVVSNPEYKSVPLTYAGRLDPMAEGLLLVLAGDEAKNKEHYLNLPKTYQFEILWGFETDTHDVLGLVSSQKVFIPTDEDIKKGIAEFVGKQKQIYPAYSSRTVDGKPLFAWAREGKISEIEIPERDIEIFNLSYKGSRKIPGGQLSKDIVEGVARVTGDFRQEQILECWQKNINEKEVYAISSFEITCSSGTYVRMLAHELGKKLGRVAIAFTIKRLSVGSYSSKDSVRGDLDKQANLS